MKTICIVILSILFFAPLFAQQVIRDTVYFEFNKHDLSEKSKQQLSLLIVQIKTLKDAHIEVLGHTDTLGSDAYNFELAANRSQEVINYFASNGITTDQITSHSLGRKKPVVPNNSDFNRKKNRRVEIQISYSTEQNNALNLPLNLPDKKKDILLIKGDNGTELLVKECSFDFPIEEIDFKIEEALSMDDMINQGLQTEDAAGNCLSSGGMISIKAYYNGTEIQPNPDCPVTIRIPTEKMDKSMKLYQGNAAGTQWELTNTAVALDDDGKMFYEFTPPSLSYFNIDKIIPTPANLLAVFKENYNGVVVKSRKLEYAKSLMVNEELMMVMKGDLFKTQKSGFPYCSCQPGSTFIGSFRKNGNYYVVQKSFSEMQYSNFWRHYLIKKNDYRQVNYSELQDIFSSL